MRIRNSRSLLPDPAPFQPSNQIIPILNIIRTWCWLFPNQQQQQQDLTKDDQASKVEKRSCTNDDSRSILGSIPDGELSTKTQLRPDSSTSAQDRSCSVHDSKKRKQILDGNANEEKESPETKFDVDNDVGDNEDEMNVNNGSTSSTPKKAKRGKVIMEGSRCSRVNGRGWRCCQATLVGYSLCEHHLGKGRLRSLASTVRQSDNDIDNGGATPLNGGVPGIVTKKRTKMVKAKSLNSF